MARRRLGHEAGLDGLRAVAIIAVLAYHAPIVAPFAGLRILPGGFLGVDLFFVLSGFLITALILGEQDRRGSVRVGAFYRRRAMRLLPALVVVLIASTLFALAIRASMRTQMASVFTTLFYVQNWAEAHGGKAPAGVLGYWSLSVEEQFYLVWPWAMIALLSLRRSARVAIPILVTAVVLVALNRARLYHAAPAGWVWIYGRTDTRADALLIGALLAQLWVRGLTPGRWFNVVAWVALIGCGVVFWTARAADGWLFYGGYTLIALGFAAIILAVLNQRWAPERVLRTRVLGVIGITSYAAYLWHGLVFNGVVRWLPHLSAWAKVATGLVLTGVVAGLSWFLVERPFLRWKTRLETRARERDAEAVAAARRDDGTTLLEPTTS